MEGFDGKGKGENISHFKSHSGARSLKFVINFLNNCMRSQRFFLKDSTPLSNGDLLVLAPGWTLHRRWPVHWAVDDGHCNYKSELKTKFMMIFYLKNYDNDTYFLEFRQGINKTICMERFCKLPHKSMVFFSLEIFALGRF